MAKKKTPYTCDFCGRPADASEVLIPSAVADVNICSECVEHLDEALKEYRRELAGEVKRAAGDTNMDNVPKPRLKSATSLTVMLLVRILRRNILLWRFITIINVLRRKKMMI